MVIEKEQEIKYLLEDLISSETFIEDLFDFFPVPTALLTPHSIVLEFNPAFEKLSGYDGLRIIGESIQPLFEKEESEGIVNETLKKKEVSDRETVLITNSKGKIPVAVFTKARVSPSGEVVGFFLSALDLSEIKQARERLKEARAALQIKVKARTEELRNFTQELEKKVKEGTKELNDKVKKLKRFHRLTKGRKEKLGELKRKNKQLKKKLDNLTQQ